MSKNDKSKLKQVKENNIKYNVGKDIDIISHPKTNENKNNSPLKKKESKRQIAKVHIKVKEEKKGEDQLQKINNEKEKKMEKKADLSEKNNNKYIEKIKELEEKIKRMNIEYSNDIQKYKNEIVKNEKDIKRLINVNANLKTNLEVLSQRFDKYIISNN
jgi:hypothetical protein